MASSSAGGGGAAAAAGTTSTVESSSLPLPLVRARKRSWSRVATLLLVAAYLVFSLMVGLNPTHSWADRLSLQAILRDGPRIVKVLVVIESSMIRMHVVQGFCLFAAAVAVYERRRQYQALQAGGKPYKSVLEGGWFPIRFIVFVSVIFCIANFCNAFLQCFQPSWLWNPALWISYRVYMPSSVEGALRGVCLEENSALCLPERSWKELSSGTMSKFDRGDTKTVDAAVAYLQTGGGSLIVNVLGRDVIDSIGPLRENLEGLRGFFKAGRLSVVVFENDSVDGSREAFKAWAEEEAARPGGGGYLVDLVTCEAEGTPDCRLKDTHRYDKTGSTESAVGKMAAYRNRILDHILKQERYGDFTHMAALDLDLSVSVSPLGVLHTFGKLVETEQLDRAIVASSGRQTWPGAYGTLVPPYDFSAFVAKPEPWNRWMIAATQRMCEVTPPGDRWRNNCNAASPFHLGLIMGYDTLNRGREPYEVLSAYHGITLYPMKLVRDRAAEARYHAGDDGQLCEHVGFHMGLLREVWAEANGQRTVAEAGVREGAEAVAAAPVPRMFINPKWDMHLMPTRPGGPSGMRFFRLFLETMSNRNIVAAMWILFTIPVIFFNTTSFFLMRLVVPSAMRWRSGGSPRTGGLPTFSDGADGKGAGAGGAGGAGAAVAEGRQVHRWLPMLFSGGEKSAVASKLVYDQCVQQLQEYGNIITQNAAGVDAVLNDELSKMAKHRRTKTS